MTKPFAEACERNQQPILEVIQPLLENKNNLLEIGSGTGQHAVFFAEKMPHITWQTADILENHQGIHLWLEDASLPNVLPPIELDAFTFDWHEKTYDAVFTANTAHIMPWSAVELMITGVGKTLKTGGLFIIYGPFNYNGQFTSESNARFEQWLKNADPERGIRDFEAIEKLANVNGMQLLNDYEMPANNRILVWEKV